jgi:iron complex transport system ATP-binding protein
LSEAAGMDGAAAGSGAAVARGAAAGESTAGVPVLEARAVSFRHHGAPSPLFDGLSVAIAGGSFSGVIGPNGSGKTTLLRLLGGLIAPAAGEVRLLGQPIVGFTPRERARRVAIVLPEPTILFNFSVLEVVLMGRAPHLGLFGLERPEDFAAARAALAVVDLEGRERRHLQELSSGERQRALIARALAQEPALLLLDEPTAFLDLKHAVEVYDVLRRLNRERGLTVVVVSHDLNLAGRYASRLILLSRGRAVADGTPDEVLTPERIGAVYETVADVVRDPKDGTPLVIPRSARPNA